MPLILASGLSLFEVLLALFLLSWVFLGVESMDYAALRLSQHVYITHLAEQQMHNMEERLRLWRGGAGLEGQVLLWNQENSLLLPQGHGTVTGAYPDYELRLSWQNKEELGCKNEHFRA